ncbi:MAG TPA: ABC transporter permease, partial [Bacteroidales bacterium]|nr:ABC transporter permease [Bacteroidales bacterium]
IFDDYMGWGREFNGTDISFKCLPVRPGFLKTIGIEVLEGRDFTEADPLKERGAFIFNQTAKEMYGLELGATLGQEGEIIGFMPDIKFSTFRNLVEPMCFYVWGTNNWGFTQPNAYIRIAAGTDVEKAIRHVHEAQEKFDSYKQDVRYFDEYIQAAYVKERNLSSLITLFSIIAILISVVGVFGLVVFESGHKRKEIGVRRVFGASIRDILVLFNRTYIKLLIICCILAMPLSYYLISRWLAGFAYKTPMFWWVFVCAFLCVSLITLLTVTFQNWRAANENPVNCLRNE